MRYIYDDQLEEYIILYGNTVIGFAETEEEAKKIVRQGYKP